MPSEVGFEQALLLIMIVTAMVGIFIGVNFYGLVTGKEGLIEPKSKGHPQKSSEQSVLFLARFGLLVVASYTLYLDYENGLLILNQASLGVESEYVFDAYCQMISYFVMIIWVFPVNRKTPKISPPAKNITDAKLETN